MTQAPHRQTPQPRAIEAPAASGVLFVDDDAPIRRLASLELRKAGIEVFAAENGAGARVLLSRLAGAADVRRALSLGVSDYIAKPFSPNELLARVTSILTAA